MSLTAIVLIAVCVQFSAASVIRSLDGIPEIDYNYCRTEECQKTADEIISNMNKSVDPCDNFYEFACGGFHARRTLREDQTSASTFTDLDDNLKAQLKELFERKTEESDLKFVKQMKYIYDSCMDLEAIEEAGSNPLKKSLQTLGGWPVVEGKQWDSTSFDWQETILNLRKHGFNYNSLPTIALMEDLKNNTIYSILIDQTVLGMPDRKYFLNGFKDNATVAYFKLMVEAAQKLGADKEFAETDLKSAFDFETTLANISLPNEERRDYNKMYNKYTVKELQELAPNVNWLKLLNGIFLDPISPLNNVVVFAPDFIKKFSELIAVTDKRTIANYVMWRVVQESMSSLSKEWRDMQQDYVAAVTGSRKEKPRSEQCIGSFSGGLSLALGSYYVKNFFKGDAKDKANELVKYIKEKFAHDLEDIDWMDQETKTKAINKANAIAPFMGYPQEILNDTLITTIHENLTVTKDSFYNNIKNLEKWTYDFVLSKLRKPSIKGDWEKHSFVAIVNAFYNPLENSIDFPAGILQKGFFNKDRPHYMNFGAIGFVIGHEVTHGFDDTGRQFDINGNINNWWSDDTDKQFRKRAECIVGQYANYTSEIGLKLNGLNTLGENIADNGGIKTSYWAYQTWMRDNSPELKLPGLHYTPNQLFWLSAANSWCTKYRPEILKLLIYADTHSPAPFRIIGPMSNLAEFSKDFECPLGSNMNPVNKCKVW